MKFKKRHSGSQLNIFTEIADLSTKHNSIDLSQGSPDYELDSRLKDFLIEATNHDMNPYASKFVIPLLQKNLLQFNHRLIHPLMVNEHEVSVVPGATYGMYVAFSTFLEPDDEVIIIEPCYDTYLPAVEIRRAKPVFVNLSENFEIDWQQIKDAITKKTKAIIINSPHNPTGKIWREKDWNTLWQIIEPTDIVVISDEVYHLISYDGHEFYSAYHHPEIKNRCFCIYSFEKMFHISGWKASYVVASKRFTKALRNIHQYLSFTVNLHAQYALAKYIETFEVEKNKIFFQKKRDLLCDLLEDLPLHIHSLAEGGYFQTINYKSDITDKFFAEMLIRNAKVATIPYSAFYHDRRNSGNIRICFAKKDETLIQAAENLKNFFKNGKV